MAEVILCEEPEETASERIQRIVREEVIELNRLAFKDIASDLAKRFPELNPGGPTNFWDDFAYWPKSMRPK